MCAATLARGCLAATSELEGDELKILHRLDRRHTFLLRQFVHLANVSFGQVQPWGLQGVLPRGQSQQHLCADRRGMRLLAMSGTKPAPGEESFLTRMRSFGDGFKLLGTSQFPTVLGRRQSLHQALVCHAQPINKSRTLAGFPKVRTSPMGFAPYA